MIWHGGHAVLDKVESVGREDVLRVAQAYFDPANLVALAVGPEDEGD